MSQRNSKIAGLVLFLVSISGLFFIALKPEKQNDKSMQINAIKLFNNNLFTENSYLKFARLESKLNTNNVSLAIVKARLEKHPYIASAKVELTDSNCAYVYLQEKRLAALLICEEQVYLLSDELQILPFYQDTKLMDLPIISNPKNFKEYSVSEYLKSSEIITAGNILITLKNTDMKLFKKLSEINLNNGEDITLTFFDIQPLIKFGSGSIPQKILSLKAIWNDILASDSDLHSYSYIDLRFADQIFLGKSDRAEL